MAQLKWVTRNPSSNNYIVKIAYDDDSEILAIQFVQAPSEAYTYDRVDREKFEGLLAAPNPHPYFNAHIRTQHHYHKWDDLENMQRYINLD